MQTRSRLRSISTEQLQITSPGIGDKVDTSRFLIPLDRGIGDTILVGLSAVDQIIQNDATAYGKIDILCSSLQSQVFEYDPRINRIIQTAKALFMGPHPSEWLRGITLNPAEAKLIDFLRNRQYEAVLPTYVAPGLYFRLHSRLMYPDLFKLGRNLFTLKAPANTTVRKMIRQMVNRYFKKDIPLSALADEGILYLDTKHVHRAALSTEQLKRMSSNRAEDAEVLLVAADSASIVTRPPTYLFAAALAEVLHRHHRLIVGILPSYTDGGAADRLRNALASDFADRVFIVPSRLIPTLLDTAALIDQADIFVTGDTGVMHLAAATKRVYQGTVAPRNSVKIIAIFGGTNPDIYGYKDRTLILGRGRKEQRAFSPGYVKELYDPKGKDLFDHITPQQLAETITSQMAKP